MERGEKRFTEVDYKLKQLVAYSITPDDDGRNLKLGGHLFNMHVHKSVFGQLEEIQKAITEDALRDAKFPDNTKWEKWDS